MTAMSRSPAEPLVSVQGDTGEPVKQVESNPVLMLSCFRSKITRSCVLMVPSRATLVTGFLTFDWGISLWRSWLTSQSLFMALLLFFLHPGGEGVCMWLLKH